MAERLYRIGHLTLQPHRELLAGETPVALGRKALELLTVLSEAEGRLVTKDELMSAVWPNVTIEENTIQVHIVALRKALGIDAELLKTVRSLGYRLIHEGVAVTHSAAAHTKVAVLPFVNLTGDSGLDCIGEGVAEELINRLSHATELRVASRTSSFAYMGHDGDARAIAYALGVDAIVEGSVRKAGDTIRITAQLVDGETGFHCWSENYDRNIGDLLALEDELGEVMAQVLKAQLAPGSEPAT